MNNYSETFDNTTAQRRSSLLGRKPLHLYGDQLLFLLVLLGMAAIKSGTRSFGLAFVAVLTAVIVDMICCRLTGKVYNPRDLSTITSGLCLALMSPVILPYQLLIFGSALAIGVKHIFGGKDNYIFNPTAVAFAFLIICYPGRMLQFPAAGETIPLFPLATEASYTLNAGLENLLLSRSAFPVITPLNILLGNFPGPIGTTHVLIILVCGVCLLLRRSVSPVVTISTLSVIVIFRLLFPIYDDIIGALVRELVGGYLLFALLFLANDPQTLPKTVFGKLYYGILLGIFTIIFRGSFDGMFRGRVEGWFIFAILATNTFSYRLDASAEKTRAGLNRIAETLKDRLSAYERFSEDAKSGKTPELSATQEIIIEPSNYDMPPIDNKVIKLNRKKRNVLTFVIEIPRSLKEKAKSIKNPPATDVDSFDSPEKFKDFFVAVAFKTLYQSIKKYCLKFINIFRKKSNRKVSEISEISETAETKEKPTKKERSSRKDDSKNNVKITDFEEIAKDIAKIEAEESENQTEEKS
ncbi:MAG: RnfABCDGE type electron transport complex subunit D [Oscillospiraceae bacterium]|nr:RnfABCDGE type electron transport complex subunit D [Oscillospiraceae bacterium]